VVLLCQGSGSSAVAVAGQLCGGGSIGCGGWVTIAAVAGRLCALWLWFQGFCAACCGRAVGVVVNIAAVFGGSAMLAGVSVAEWWHLWRMVLL